MLRIEGANIRQGDFTLSADLSFASNRKYGVIGPSGAGKSTLLAAIAGFVPIQCGRLFWADHEITEDPPNKRPITMLFQDNNLFPHLSVFQNVGLGMRPDLRLDSRQARQVNEALARVGLFDKADQKPGALSGGQQSRAALARVLVQSRPVILLDEPFAALGPALRQDMLELVEKLSDETEATVIMVTHMPADVERMADEVIFVDAGQAIAAGDARAFLNDPPPALSAYLGKER
ncbi:MAG: ATP-binding cassette domain-containing protein [Pseudomonadota bacterium]